MNNVKKTIEQLKFKHLPKINTPHKNVDVKFLEAMGLKVIVYEFWQVALEYEDLPKGNRFMWYPTTGTLVYEGIHGNTRPSKRFFDSEEVFNEIMKRVNH